MHTWYSSIIAPQHELSPELSNCIIISEYYKAGFSTISVYHSSILTTHIIHILVLLAQLPLVLHYGLQVGQVITDLHS